ncbi:methyltransferase family protein [Pseudomonas sp. N040]|uniref:methyltransferase family protein n=1 Tax=Pseudomonas sp. N040 TaxID=2785325 RepID=UPI0018A2FBFF|nr:isoprenylcysteine carboxylmethyltransferase family protein [Pseudomonas sp. N040]MBF7728910.1 isoprenylcysteine carboxylmethyltransferase family protein [Pseudomonas sp. N040]MBW7012550.1 isoprenylcysteine carboxylmethyltransferase family protein [Pseudomonas sp. N040]
MNALELKIPPPLVMLLTGLLMWLLATLSPAATLALPYQGYLSLLAGLAGACLIGVSVLLFVRARTTIEPTHPGRAARLVTGGFNRISRNPMYLGLLLWLLAWALWLGNGLALLCLPAFVAYLNRFQISLEERFLAQKFGEQYAHYRARVRRWL